MDDLVNLAARLWRAESEEAGLPPSVAERRTPQLFTNPDETSDETRARWMKFARAAHEHTAARIAELEAERDELRKERRALADHNRLLLAAEATQSARADRLAAMLGEAEERERALLSWIAKGCPDDPPVARLEAREVEIPTITSIFIPQDGKKELALVYKDGSRSTSIEHDWVSNGTQFGLAEDTNLPFTIPDPRGAEVVSIAFLLDGRTVALIGVNQQQRQASSPGPAS